MSERNHRCHPARFRLPAPSCLLARSCSGSPRSPSGQRSSERSTTASEMPPPQRVAPSSRPNALAKPRRPTHFRRPPHRQPPRLPRRLGRATRPTFKLCSNAPTQNAPNEASDRSNSTRNSTRQLRRTLPTSSAKAATSCRMPAPTGRAHSIASTAQGFGTGQRQRTSRADIGLLML